MTYVVDRNVNYSNVCVSVCTFCAFYRKPGSPEGYVHSYEEIFQKVEEMIELGGSGMVHPNVLETVGGAAFITSLFTFVPTAANVTYYLEIVRDKYILRQIISACTESVRRSFEEQDEVNNLLDEVEQKIFSVGEDRFKGHVLTMKDQVMEAIESIEKLYERKGGITGISTGFVEFDRMTSGLHPSEMVVIAARPSMGKTALAMNIAEHVAINEQHPS